MRYFSSPGSPRHAMDSRDGTPKREWVAPFGNPGIEGCSHLPRAYRSVPRPSSPLDAKASTRCPSFTHPAPADSCNGHAIQPAPCGTNELRQCPKSCIPMSFELFACANRPKACRANSELNEHHTFGQQHPTTRTCAPVIITSRTAACVMPAVTRLASSRCQ